MHTTTLRRFCNTHCNNNDMSYIGTHNNSQYITQHNKQYIIYRRKNIIPDKARI